MYYIGIDLGGTIIKIGLTLDGRVLASERLKADSDCGLRPKLGPMADIINKLINQCGLSTNDLGGILLAFPGIVDVKKKRAAATNAKYNDAPDVDMVSWARDNWNAPFAMDNDARIAAVGEWLYGAGQGYDNMVMMTIGTGIGTGTIIDGHLIYGRSFCAGALGGHMIIDYKGRKCTCGNIGCVEAHGSSFFLPHIIEDNKNLTESFIADRSNQNFKTIFDKYRSGDSNAKTLAKECMDVWSAGIINYIHAYDPEIVVIGGGIMKSSDIILPYIKEKVGALAWQPFGPVEIVASKLGDDAALLAAEYYFKNKN